MVRPYAAGRNLKDLCAYKIISNPLGLGLMFQVYGNGVSEGEAPAGVDGGGASEGGLLAQEAFVEVAAAVFARYAEVEVAS